VWSASRSGRFYPRERPGTHCTGGWVGPGAGLDRCGKSRPTGIRSPDLPGRSESLYWLSCPGSSAYLDKSIKTPDCSKEFISSLYWDLSFISLLITNWTSQRTILLLQKLTVLQLLKRLPAFCGNRWFMAVFTTASHFFLSLSTIQYTPSRSDSWKSILSLFRKTAKSDY
jgi:hypothetical protein